MLWKSVIASALCALSLSGCHDATALQCPTPQLQSSAGDLKESASDIQAYRDRFASGFSQNNIQEAIVSLRKKYPGAPKSAITNYLVAAYCPNASSQAVGVSDQRAKLASFESAVRAQIGN
jgi:hypothetical protein